MQDAHNTISGPLVLIVEPDTLELRKLREILSKEGFAIVTATDVETARRLCNHLSVNLVLGNASVLGFSHGNPV